MGLFDFNINPHVDVHINTEEIAGSNYKAKVLKPNLVDGVNTLAQEMIDECGANTVFVIKYDYQIDETIAFPENSVIHFDGGSFNGGTVVGNNTKVFNPYEAEAFNGTAKQGSFVDLSAVDWEEISNKPSFATVATTGSYNDLTDKPVIPTGQVQSDWNQGNTSAPDYIKGKPTKLSDFTDDSSFINGASYDSQNKRINFKHNNTVVAWIDAAPFIIDGMVSDVKIVSGNLVVKFNTDAGKQDLIIPLTDIFNPNNYYTKAQVDTELGKKADASSLANVATSGNYNDLNNKPAIPVVPTKVSAFDNDAKYVKQESLENFLDVTSTKGQTIRGELTLCAGATIPSLEKLDVLGNIESVNGFKKKDSSDDYVLLAGGGTKALSEIMPSEFNGVTLDTKQTITGEKWFSGNVSFLYNSFITVHNIIKVGGGDSFTWIEPWRITLSHVISPAPRRTAETILDAEGITSPQFIVKGGTSSQFLKADGSVDDKTYLPTELENVNGNIFRYVSTENSYGNQGRAVLQINKNRVPSLALKDDADDDGDYNSVVVSAIGISFHQGDLDTADLDVSGSFGFNALYDYGDRSLGRVYTSTIVDFFVNQVSSSDETLKDKVADIELSAEQIASAPSIKYTWKDKEKGSKVYIGTTAQYWKNIIPEAVSEGKDGKLGLNYQGAAMVAVISLAKEVVALREKVSSLEERLAKLEQLMTNK